MPLSCFVLSLIRRVPPTPMKTLISLLVLAVIASVCNAATPSDPDLVGVWKLTKATYRGKDKSPPSSTVITHTFVEGQAVLVKVNGELERHRRYKVDVTTKPKRIEIESMDGPQAGTTRHGIYEVTGNTLKICTVTAGSPVPERFESSDDPKTKAALDIFERSK